MIPSRRDRLYCPVFAPFTIEHHHQGRQIVPFPGSLDSIQHSSDRGPVQDTGPFMRGCVVGEVAFHQEQGIAFLYLSVEQEHIYIAALSQRRRFHVLGGDAVQPGRNVGETGHLSFVSQAVDTDDSRTVLSRADSALYSAKAAGRNCVFKHTGIHIEPIDIRDGAPHVASVDQKSEEPQSDPIPGPAPILLPESSPQLPVTPVDGTPQGAAG